MAAVDRYAELHAAHRWNVPDDFNIAHACCGRWADDRARFALYWEDEDGARVALTFFDLQQQANRLSNALAAAGVSRGDRIALILPQRPETIVAHLAVHQLAAVAVPLSFLFGPEALEYRLQNSAAKIAFVDPQSLPNLLPIRDRCPALTHVIGVAGAAAPGIDAWESLQSSSRHFARVATRATDPAVLIYTSGTTGPPKGALMPQQCLLGNLPGFVHSHDAYPQPGDLFWSPADWAWTGGLMDALLPTLYFGQPIVGYRGRFDPERAFRLIERYQIRNTFLFPTALKLMMKAYPRPRDAFDISLRTIMSAGEAVGTAVFEWARDALGVTINEMFGQTEMNYIVGNSQALWPAKPGSMGRPYPTMRATRCRPASRAKSPCTASRRTARPIRCSSSSISAIARARAASSPAIGAAPATSRSRMKGVTCGTRAAPTTCSRRRGTGSVRPKSRTASSGIRRLRTPPSFHRPMKRAATSSMRSSCSPPAIRRRPRSKPISHSTSGSISPRTNIRRKSSSSMRCR
jgi:acetyl-CoA synthetase